MGRLIDADALREYLGIETADCTKCKDGFSIYGYCKRGGDFQTACYAIDTAPTVDAVPVRHGQWIPCNSKYGHNEKVYLCNQCNHNVGFKKMNFCPICGAQMDGEGNGNGNES